MQDTTTSQPTQQERPSPLPPRELLILGAGHFGSLAARRLHKRYPQATFLVVDENRAALAELARDLNVSVKDEDAVAFLGHTLISESLWIVPAVPVHVVFKWLETELGRRGSFQALPVPELVDSQVPNPFRVETGTVYASYATFRCPDNCSEPADICTHTKKPRLGNLFADLARVRVEGYRTIVMRSHQLCPGVGGYTGRNLMDLRDAIIGRPGPYLVATSCRCHAVIDAFRWQPSVR